MGSASSTTAPGYEPIKSDSFGAERIAGVPCCPEISHEACNVALDDIVGSWMMGANVLEFHQVISLSPATPAGGARSLKLCRVGNHRILEFSKKLGEFKLRRGIVPDAA
jgi:hypothetical protein